MGQAPPAVAKHARSGWSILSNCQIGTAHIDIVLIQPESGVVLLEIEPHWAPNAMAQLRQRLDAAGFAARYPGHLPIIHQPLRPQEVPKLDLLLAAAFVWQEPISIEGDGAWEAALKAVLSQPATIQPSEPPPPLPVPPPPTPRKRMPGLTLTLLGAVGIGLVMARSIGEEPEATPVVVWDDQPLPGMPAWSQAPADRMVALPGAGDAPQPDAVGVVQDGDAILASATADLAPSLVIAEASHAPQEATQSTPPEDAAPPVWFGTLPIPEPEDVLAAEPPPTHPVEHMLETASPPAQAAAPEPDDPPPAEATAAAPPPEPMIALPPVDAPAAMAEPEPIREPEAPEPMLPAPAMVAEPAPPEEAPAPGTPAAMTEVPPGSQPQPEPALPAPPRAEPPVLTPRTIPMAPTLLVAMLQRGQSLMALGDISGARRFFERAAAAGSAVAAHALAETYDPRMLALRGALGIEPDLAAARLWYDRAKALSAAEAPTLTKTPEERP